MGVDLSETLPELLKARGMTQAQLAEATGIRRTDVNALVRGRVKAGPKRLALIAEALQVSPAELGDRPAADDLRAQTLVRRLEAVEASLARIERSRRQAAAAIYKRLDQIQAALDEGEPERSRRPRSRATPRS